MEARGFHYTQSMKRFIKISITCLFIIIASVPPLSAKTEILEAQWQAHQVRFRFVGMSTAYTCEGIESTLRRLLKLLGARDDIRAESACTNSSKPERFHRVKLAFALPVPANKTDISREIIPAKWEEVKVVSHSSRHLDDGDCELLEQFERQVLPLLQIHNLHKKLNCIPYRHNYSTSRLRFTALKALKKTELEESRNEVSNDTSQPD